MSLISQAWQLELRGVLMGAQTNIEIRQDGIDGTGLPGLRTKDVDRAFGHGSVAGIDWMEPRELTVPLEVFGRGPADTQQKLSELVGAWRAGGDTELVIEMPAGRRTLFGRARRCEPNMENLRSGCVEVDCQFLALDPLFYGELHTVDIADPVSGYGHGFPLDLPHGFGTVIEPIYADVFNSGNVATQRINARIYGPASRPRLTLLDTGETLALDIDIVGGDWIDVDFAAGTVLYRGEGRRWPETVASVWWELPVGGSRVQYRTAGAGAGSVCSFAWRNAHNSL